METMEMLMAKQKTDKIAQRAAARMSYKLI
jgi:hypothetical protein